MLRVGIVAELEDRIKTAMKRESLDKKEAEKALVARGKARHHFFKRLFDIDEPDASELYQIVINTSLVRTDYAVGMIVDAANAIDQKQLGRQVQIEVPAK